MFAVIELLFIIAAVIFTVRNGKGKEKLYGLLPLCVIAVSTFAGAIAGAVYGPEAVKGFSRTPVGIVVSILSFVLIVAVALWAVNHVRLRKAERAAEEA